MDKSISGMIDTSIIEELIDECPKSTQDLEKLPLYSILLVLGGYIALGIGSLHFVITMLKDFDFYAVFHLLTNLLFGFGLLISYHRIKREIKRWALVAIVFSLALIALGGVVGGLAGLIGIFGGVLALLGEFDEDWKI